MKLETCDVCIIGAGPSGAVAAALLRQQGLAVTVLEQQTFPRFSIGESLLPQSLEYLEAAGLLPDVVDAGYQYQNGAAFLHGAAARVASAPYLYPGARTWLVEDAFLGVACADSRNPTQREDLSLIHIRRLRRAV